MKMTSKTDRRKIGRIGVIDVGSNSVRFVVFDGDQRAPAYFYDEKVLCGLGRGMVASGFLNAEGKARALTAIHRFSLLAKSMKLDQLRAVATAAVREARDGPQFCQQVNYEFGIKLRAISGTEEAKMAASGVLLGWPEASGLVCDIGGSSMEFAALKSGEIKRAVTTDLGPLSIADAQDHGGDLAAYIRARIAAKTEGFHRQQDRLFLVGGSWRAIARLHMELNAYPLAVLHGYALTRATLMTTLDALEDEAALARLNALPISQSRVGLVPVAAQVLREVLGHFDVQEVVFSSFGLREGVYLSQMRKSLQRLDPLIEAAQAEEQRLARFAGFGDVLYHWIEPLFADQSASQLRLIRAACLLHDVNWRSHPDFRAAVCFETATHANLGGVSHAGRVFIAWALYHRYKSKTVPEALDALAAILSEDEIQLARVVGRAMRLGAMLNGAAPDQMGTLSVQPQDLRLELNMQGAEFMGEVVEKRLMSLASAMGLTAQIRLV